MRDIAQEKMWLSNDVNQIVAKLEHYFYFQNRRRFEDTWRSDHWIYSRLGMYDVLLEIHGEKHRSWFLISPNGQLDYYLQNGYVVGNCADETAFVEAWLKSLGIAATGQLVTCDESEHMYSIYYDPSDNTWKDYPGQLSWYVEESNALGVELNLRIVRIFRHPVEQKGYLRIYTIPPNWLGGNMFVTIDNGFTLASIREAFTQGVPSSQMKQWLLYS
jgi:hypothetical protein